MASLGGLNEKRSKRDHLGPLEIFSPEAELGDLKARRGQEDPLKGSDLCLMGICT